MSRPTDTERGARIALGASNAVFNAEHSPMFAVRLSMEHRELWQGIQQAARIELEEARSCRREVARG